MLKPQSSFLSQLGCSPDVTYRKVPEQFSWIRSWMVAFPRDQRREKYVRASLSGQQEPKSLQLNRLDRSQSPKNTVLPWPNPVVERHRKQKSLPNDSYSCPRQLSVVRTGMSKKGRIYERSPIKPDQSCREPIPPARRNSWGKKTEVCLTHLSAWIASGLKRRRTKTQIRT